MADIAPIDGPLLANEAGSILHDYIKGEFKLSMWIPEELAGRVVGKQGAVISNLQRDTKALIKALARVGESLWVAVVILGEWKSAVAAYKSISDIVHGEVDDVVLEFMINYKKPFFLYGKHKFNAIRYISAKTSVRIYLPEFDVKKQSFKEAEYVTLEGSMDGVVAAVGLLEEEARGYRENMIERKGPRPLPSDAERAEAKEEVRPKAAPTVVKEEEPNWREARDRQQQQLQQQVKEEKKEKERPREAVSPKELLQQPAQGPGPERLVTIPGHIVGLLLSKKNMPTSTSRATVLNQLQYMTRTTISKVSSSSSSGSASEAVPVPSTPEAVQEEVEEEEEQSEDESSEEPAAGRRRRADADGSDSDDETESEGSADESSDDDDSAAFEDSLEHPVPAVPVPAPTSAASATAAVVSHSTPSGVLDKSAPATFRIAGSSPAGIALAHDALMRILQGDRIRDVVDGLKVIAAAAGLGPAAGAGPAESVHKPPGTGTAKRSKRGGKDRKSSGRGRDREAGPAAATAAASGTGSGSAEQSAGTSSAPAAAATAIATGGDSGRGSRRGGGGGGGGGGKPSSAGRGPPKRPHGTVAAAPSTEDTWERSAKPKGEVKGDSKEGGDRDRDRDRKHARGSRGGGAGRESSRKGSGPPPKA